MNLWDRWRMFTFEDLPRSALGLVVLVLLGAVVAGVALVATSGVLQDRYEMSGTFLDVSGLKTGSTVTVAGVDVGQVTGVAPDFENGTVEVTWEVDRGVDLGRSTRARLASETLFGGQQIRLSGPVEEPLLASLPTPERHIPLDRTSRATDVVEAIDTATQTAEGVDVDLVNDVSGVLAELAAANRGQLDGLFAQLQAVASALSSREQELGRLLENAQRMTRTLSEKDEQLFALVESASALLDELTAREQELRALLGEGTDGVVTLSGFLREHRQSIEAIVTDLGVTLEGVQGDLDDLDRTLAFLGPSFGAVPRTRGDGDWIDFLITSVGPPEGS